MNTPPQSPRSLICPPAPIANRRRHRSRCFGGIICRTNGHEPQYLVVKGRQTGIWSFPKGHSRHEEHPLDCAKREIQEETGIPIQILDLPHPRLHRLKGGIYYLFDLTPFLPYDPSDPSNQFTPQDTMEIEETRWVTREEMTYLISNSGIKDFLEKK